MDSIVHIIIAVIGSSGIVGIIITTAVKRQLEKQYEKQNRREELRDENNLLMMSRMDNVSDMTHLMAKKLHDAGIINGDLKELDEKYKELDSNYDKNIKKLALEVLNK